MASNIRPRLTIDISGQPYQFSQPFVITTMELEQDPLQCQVSCAVSATTTLWDGAPPFSTMDFAAFVSDLDLTLNIQIDGGSASDYTLALRAGLPLVIHGAPSGAEVTQITATNADSANVATVTQLIGQIAA